MAVLPIYLVLMSMIRRYCKFHPANLQARKAEETHVAHVKNVHGRPKLALNSLCLLFIYISPHNLPSTQFSRGASRLVQVAAAAACNYTYIVCVSVSVSVSVE